MTSERVIISEVQQPPAFMYTAGEHLHEHSEHRASKVTLAEAKESMVTVLVPDYLPIGYELSRVNLAPSGEIVMLVYTVPEPETEVHTQLEIVQGGTISEDGVIVKTGYAESVNVRSGQNGHLMRGQWVPTVHQNGAVDISWIADASVTLFFESHAGLILLRGEPASAWPDTELLRVADSLSSA